MSYSFTDWESTWLAHHGIKGMKWGVRRFQNEDGSLTEAGKARVAKAGRYLNPDLKTGKRYATRNRQEVSSKYVKEWNNNHDSMYEHPHVPNFQNQKKLWDKYKDAYAGATLKDLKLKDSKKARSEIKRILKDIDSDYKFPMNYDVPSESQREEYRKRRNEMIHYKREKIKRGAKKIKAFLYTPHTAKKLIKG